MRRLICYFALGASLLPSAVLAQDLSGIEAEAQADLAEALEELADLRAAIREEKIPLGQERRSLEAEVRALRDEAEAARAVQDNADLRLDQLRNLIRAREEEMQFASNLLDEYVRGLQARVHVAEVERYETSLKAILDEAERAEEPGSSAPVLVEGLGVGLDRAQGVLGGEVFAGRAVLPDGRVQDGQFFLMGPFAYFSGPGGSGEVMRGESLRPSVAPVPDEEIGQAIDAIASGQLAAIPLDATLGKARSIAQTEETFLEHVAKGGVWIVPILAFALISITVAIFKAMELFSIKLPTEGSVTKLTGLIEAEDYNKAREEAARLPGPVGEMLRVGVQHSRESIGLIEELLIEKVVEAQPKVNRLLMVIATTAAVAPLLGLLGTVTGMINTFKLITIFGTGDARNLSSGISEALITTEFGLIVAIPALILHAVLSRRASTILGAMERQAITFVNGLKVIRERT